MYPTSSLEFTPNDRNFAVGMCAFVGYVIVNAKLCKHERNTSGAKFGRDLSPKALNWE